MNLVTLECSLSIHLKKNVVYIVLTGSSYSTLVSVFLYYHFSLICIRDFSSAVFEENVKVLTSHCRQHWSRHAKTLIFLIICVTAEDIYFKHRLVIYYQKGNPHQ